MSITCRQLVASSNAKQYMKLASDFAAVLRDGKNRTCCFAQKNTLSWSISKKEEGNRGPVLTSEQLLFFCWEVFCQTGYHPSQYACRNAEPTQQTTRSYAR